MRLSTRHVNLQTANRLIDGAAENQGGHPAWWGTRMRTRVIASRSAFHAAAPNTQHPILYA
jgi:uncharacterized protein (DUF433 family)